MNSMQSHITVPLGKKAHFYSGQFAASATSPDTGKRVYLNTLAVYAVHCYLAWLRVETSLEQSDSWSVGLQNLSDVADLFLPGIGYLECRPVFPEETVFTIPPQATEGRIGYVAVWLHESLERAELLGFYNAIAPANRPQQILLSQLQPLDVLLEYLSTETQMNASNRTVTNLSCWRENTFEKGWLTLETLFDEQTANIALSVRNKHQLGEIDSAHSTNAVKRGKIIDLKVQLQDKRVALIVTCQPANKNEMEIRLQVCPTDSFVYLPQSLQLAVLDNTGATIPELEAQARSADNCIQLEFTGNVGEQFSVKIALEDVNIIEDFQI